MATDKKRVTISLSDERYADFEKLVKETGFTKSTLVTSWILKELEKQNQKGIKKANAGGVSKIIVFKVIILYGKRKIKILHVSTLS